MFIRNKFCCEFTSTLGALRSNVEFNLGLHVSTQYRLHVVSRTQSLYLTKRLLKLSSQSDPQGQKNTIPLKGRRTWVLQVDRITVRGESGGDGGSHSRENLEETGDHTHVRHDKQTEVALKLKAAVHLTELTTASVKSAQVSEREEQDKIKC